jgi:flagellar motor switch protein FliG
MASQYLRENKNIVITTYGHDRIIDKISVSLFDCFNDGDQNIENYCTTINNLELKDNNWVFAKLISQNTPYFLHAFIPLQFTDVIQKLDNRALQKVIRETFPNVLAKALKNENEDIQSKIFKGMTKRAVTMLKEDMECMGQIGQKETEQAKNEILFIIRRLIETGEILSPYKDYEEA